jgi:hypothetical protein
MTRKHFQAIAADFAKQAYQYQGQDRRCGAGTPLEALYALALRMSATFEQMNVSFDSSRFLDACGFPQKGN